ncbi:MULTISPECIES: TonB-dependent receptor [Sphingobium]|uniref:TonB-dependent receptor-like protein n=1 Tax=Sphingobium indicum (strain DSM 16413 / CCM 7287 / MTCC 6362 / UT26 / NBRC 101211 / UT26S) TaxID=452662 RepID=D4Z760_SPHIU|nr:TonB-dependent receptor [Sphingobium indicum]BAI98918.1 TonB-dependent receptor-like protein [Sphingobium indicum UT26S]
MTNFGYRRRWKWALLVSATIELAASGTAWAQAPADADMRADITVTARKVPEPLLKAPLAVTSISGDSIVAAGLQTITDLTRMAPNVDISGGIAGQLQGQISIRGISTLVRNIGLETGVGIYVDDVYVGRPENFVQHLLDVDRVEIVRGPQGTEYGKNTIAGVVNVQTKQPDADPGASIRLDAGNYDYRRGEAVLGTRLNERLSVRGAVAYARQDGFYKHLSGGKDAGSTDLLTWRLSAKYAPTDQLSFIARWEGLRDRGTPAFFQADALAGYPADFPSREPLHINNNRPNRLHRDSQGISMRTEWASDAITLTAITAYRDSSYHASLDDDQEQVDFVSADNFSDDSHFFSQELRLAGGTGKLRYLLGAYYFDQMVRTDRGLGLGADTGVPGEPMLTTKGSVKTESGALFGRLDYELTDRLSLSAGLRYTREKKRAHFVQDDASGTGIFTYLGFPNLTFDGRSTDDDLSPSATISYEVVPDANVYARFSRGFKSAAYNVDLASSLGGLTASPEKATSYEVGLKMLTLDRRMRLNLAAFHTDYDRLQVSQVLGSGLALTNAGRAQVEGVEGELSLQLTSRLQLEGNAAILDAHYKRFDNCGVPASVIPSVGSPSTDCTGNDLVLAPHFTGYGAVSYEVPVRIGTIFVRADVDHRSTVYFEPTNSDAFKAGPRTLVNLRFGLRRGQWDIAAWVQNLTDRIYKTYADDRSGLGVYRTAAYGPPRTYGVSLSATF